MKVLLVNTNLMKPPVAPIGLDYLADSIRAAGHEPQLLDLCFSDDIEKDIAAAAGALNPDVIGVSVRNTDDCYFASGAFFLPGICEVVASLRRASDAPIVMGGVGFSVMPEAVMDFCGADLGVAGEGEEAFVQLLEALRTKSGLDKVAGLIWREKGTLRRNPSIDSRLDMLPPRTRSLVDNRRYFREGGQAGFETKRGCAMACVYCADPVSKGRRVRLRSPRLVVEELLALLDQGIDHFHTCDCEFNLPAEHARDICQAIIDSGLGGRIRWYAYCAITPFDEDTALLFKRAGCAGIDFGADSGNEGMLRRLGRHFGPEDILQTARCCRAAGIPFMYDLLVGGPGETRESVRETIDLMRRAEPDCIGVSLGVRVYDGTPLAALVRSQGDMPLNPALHGAKKDNPRFLRPVFYLSPHIGEQAAGFVRDLVGADERFFLPSSPEAERDYNYNDNTLLSDAIAKGARGAYWDILRRMRKGG
ncbi:MAG: cobalamin B12-binding domain-containing protein [Spirochaetes bacterium]|nr:cobalamin B12-binding domain-containing protein [Spirochaetota bacterium]